MSMNANMTISSLAMALDTAFEATPDGQDYLDAYLDPVGIPTIAKGITRMPDGRAVKMGDKLTTQQAALLNSTIMGGFEKGVLDMVKVPINQNQFDALVMLAKNIGLSALKNSEGVMRNLNEGRYADAAYHFGDWVYAAKESRQNDDGTITYATDPNGDPMPLGRKWYVAYRGLYRRHVSEALLFLGLNWTKAAHEDRIELRATTVWEPAKNRWKDRVDYKTPWEDIVAMARKYPLPVMAAEKPRTVAAENAETVDLNNAQLIALGGTPGQPIRPAPLPEAAKAPATKIVTKTGTVINTEDEPVKMEKSKTGKAVNRASRGKETTIIGGLTGTGVTAAAVNAEKVGAVIEKFKPETFLVMGGMVCLFLLVMGGIMWWSGRAEAYHRRLNEQEAKY